MALLSVTAGEKTTECEDQRKKNPGKKRRWETNEAKANWRGRDKCFTG